MTPASRRRHHVALFLVVAACSSAVKVDGAAAFTCRQASDCAGGWVCRQGVCTSTTGEPSCGEGALWCAPACVAVASDSFHCGSCERVCDGGVRCSDGACRPVDVEWAQWAMSPDAGPLSQTEVFDDAVFDRATGLWWQRVAPTTRFTWDDAKTACAALSLHGLSGWRLPTVAELVTLLDGTKPGAAIDEALFPGAPADRVWTATSYAPNPSRAWVVAFDYGPDPTTSYAKTDGTVLRCVR